MKLQLARAAQIGIDLLALAAAYAGAYLLRFEFAPSLQHTKLLFFTGPYVIILQYLALLAFGVPRFAWRYVGLRESWRILSALLTATAVLAVLRLTLGPVGGYARFVVIPLSILAIDGLLAFIGITGVRVLRRVLAERAETRSRPAAARQPVATLLVGAGRAGLMVAKEIAGRPDLGILPVGFVDDDDRKRGASVHGIRVLGATHELAAIAARTEARQVLITMAGVSGATVRRVLELCDGAGLPAKIVPGLFELVGGRGRVARIRNVAIEDLLRREPVELDTPAIAAFLRGRTVLVTGAGGSIGSEICRQVAGHAPARLILVERAENSLFHIHRELGERFGDLPVEPQLVDITNESQLRGVFAAARPDVVFHAAAHKHVPMLEWNAAEAVRNNVRGTRQIADLAHEFEVQRFVMISTDKAVNPSSVMGATKRVAELYVQTLARTSATRFIAVRFGNVLGSAGSVVPLFQQQIDRGGPVTITHPEMRRYFMTIPEACQLVLQAATMGAGGEIFILDMGEPVRIVDLARDLIRLSGYRPDIDIPIQFTGIRPGEKLFEQLAVAGEHADKTRHPKIFVGRLEARPAETVRADVEALIQLGPQAPDGAVRALLARVLPDYRPGPPAPAAASAPAAPTPERGDP